MEQFKRTQIILLPTKDKTRIILSKNNKIFDSGIIIKMNKLNSDSYQHLYITSDDKIKEGDYVYDSYKHSVYQATKVVIHNMKSLDYEQYLKKIIATTDTSLKVFIDGSGNKSLHELTKSGYVEFLPQPSEQFITKYIEEYNKGNIITDVLVEYEHYDEFGNYISGDIVRNNDILKLKVNHKDNTITIKKLKDNWNREEVKDILESYRVFTWKVGCSKQDLIKWIEKNL